MKEIKALKCDFCSKLYQLERFAIAHEIKCKKNPANKRVCFECEFCEKEDTTHFWESNGEYGYREHHDKISILKCSKLNIFVYPPKVEHSESGNYLTENIGDGEIENVPMKKECEFFKLKEWMP